MEYESDVQVARVPLAVALDVTVAPARAPAFGERGLPQKLEVVGHDFGPGDEVSIAQTLKASLEQDLRKNGPFSVDGGQAPARLRILVNRYNDGRGGLWTVLNALLFFVPSLVGVPTHTAYMEVEAFARLEHASGQLVAEANSNVSCSRSRGLYYNSEISMDCAARGAMEDLRRKLALQKDSIVANVARADRALMAAKEVSKKKSEDEARALAAKQAADPARNAEIVVAVFDLEDGGGQLADADKSQLTDYLATRMAEVVGYQVVPRAQLRERITAEKAVSYGSCFDEACQIELGKALAAQKTVSTKLIRVGSTCAVTSTIYDLKREATEKAASAKTECTADALIGAVDQIVTQLRGSSR